MAPVTRMLCSGNSFSYVGSADNREANPVFARYKFHQTVQSLTEIFEEAVIELELSEEGCSSEL